MFVFGLYSYKNVTVQSSTTELQSCSQYFYRTRKNWGDTSPSKRRSATMDSLKMGTSSLTLKIHLFIKTHFMTKMVKAVFCALILKREACLLVTSVTTYVYQQVAKQQVRRNQQSFLQCRFLAINFYVHHFCKFHSLHSKSCQGLIIFGTN